MIPRDEIVSEANPTFDKCDEYDVTFEEWQEARRALGLSAWFKKMDVPEDTMQLAHDARADMQVYAYHIVLEGETYYFIDEVNEALHKIIKDKIDDIGEDRYLSKRDHCF